MCYSLRTSLWWWITHSVQRQLKGCNNIPSFLQRTTPIVRSFCEGCTRHDLHILATVLLCCDLKARVASAQSFTLWQQAELPSRRKNSTAPAPEFFFSWTRLRLRLQFRNSWFSRVWLQLRSSLFHGSSSGFCSFSHINIAIVLVCLKLNGKWIKSNTQN